MWYLKFIFKDEFSVISLKFSLVCDYLYYIFVKKNWSYSESMMKYIVYLNYPLKLCSFFWKGATFFNGNNDMIKKNCA